MIKKEQDFLNEPWMDTKEVEMIQKYLNPKSIVLEYGCGGSTQFFSRSVKRVVSVEHNKEWYEKVASLKLENVDLNYVRPEFPHKGFDPAAKGQFKRYVIFPERFGRIFDCVLVDGRARTECAIVASYLIKNDGVLFFHDFCKRRSRYTSLSFRYRYVLVESVEDTEQTLAIFKLRYFWRLQRGCLAFYKRIIAFLRKDKK